MPLTAHTSESTPLVLSVSQLTSLIKDSLESEFSDVWVGGEITDLSQSHAGHIYFGLKDGQAQLRAVIWQGSAARLKFRPQDGMAVICRGEINVYPPRGSYQLIVRSLEPQGEGALQLAFRQLHARLSKEGLFDARHKQPLPKFPRRVAVVTSPTGAAVRDFLEVVRRRWPQLEVLVIPARVQGEGAAADLVKAIDLANRLQPQPDVLLVTRGGGSLEDLWCFNEEPVVRAIFRSRIPVVSAVGHEIDVTLSDLAADVRALTPTEAAELMTPSREQLSNSLRQAGTRLSNALRQQALQSRARLEGLAQRRCFRRPFDRIRELARRADELDVRATASVRRQLTRSRDRMRALAAQLESLSPLAVLSRGYSVTTRWPDDTLVDGIEQLQPGERLLTRLTGGQVTSRVEHVERRETGDVDGRRTEPEETA